VVLLIMAVVFGVIGWLQVVDLHQLRERGEVVTGTVVEKYGARTQHIAVEFVTRKGEKVRAETSNFDQAEVGQQIEVIYDRDDPQTMQAADWGLGYGLIVTMFGLVAVGFAVGGIVKLRS
jgi:hypothetical protein